MSSNLPPRSIRLLAHNIRSLWNVGAFFRTCDALRVERLYLTGYTGHPPRKEISKTALRAEEWVEWEYARDPFPVIRSLQNEGWHIAALELTEEALPLHAFSAPEKICLIVGNELEGVTEPFLKLCDSTVCIPMLGKKESLNVAVATGMALYRLRFSSAQN